MKKIIDVPYSSQMEYGALKYNNDCGATSCDMFNRLYKMYKDKNTDYMYELIRKDIDAYLSLFDLAYILYDLDIPSMWTYGKNIDWLKREIDNDNPYIALIKYSEIAKINPYSNFQYNHFLVVVGYDDESIYVNDPLWKNNGGKNLKIPTYLFNQIWFKCGVGMIDSFYDGETIDAYRVIASGVRIRSGAGFSYPQLTGYGWGNAGHIYYAMKEEIDEYGNLWIMIRPGEWIVTEYYDVVMAKKIGNLSMGYNDEPDLATELELDIGIEINVGVNTEPTVSEPESLPDDEENIIPLKELVKKLKEILRRILFKKKKIIMSI